MINFSKFQTAAVCCALSYCMPVFADDSASSTALGIGELSANSSAHSVILNLSQPLSGGSGVGYKYEIWRASQPGVAPQGKPYAETSTFPYADNYVVPGAGL